MKLFKSAVLASLIGLFSIQATQAAIGSMAFVVGMFGTSAQYALIGIGWTYAGNKIHPRNERLGYIALVAGLILLDNEANKVDFKEISEEDSILKGLTQVEMQSYNNEIEEVNIVFSEVASQINKETTKLEIQELWETHSEFLSPEAFSALKKIVK
jgi:hypothetical protein